uniref:Uncharacterized protein n=1 Tax=Grammatophora oceanica TaxID=210454 RepID=A0A7S1VFZ9_9STRA
MRLLIEQVRHNHPNVTVVWKAPSATHAHVVVNRRSPFGSIEKATKRIKYLSTSRSADLYHFQKEICRELNVPFMDVYDAYFLSGDWHFPTDGRHYRPELNHVIFNWFDSRPQNISVDYRYRGYGRR